jgi:hypothetical protein
MAVVVAYLDFEHEQEEEHRNEERDDWVADFQKPFFQ